MSQLFFKKQFFAAIREGSKCTTIRRWPRPRVRAGREAYAPHIGWLHIERVQRVSLRELREADARADGFDSRSAMLRTLREIYPDHRTDGKRWFRILFRPARLLAPRPAADATPPVLF